MDIEVAKKLIGKRLASRDYRLFLLADLFYDGYYPKDEYAFITSEEVKDFNEDEFIALAYNSLKRQTKKKRNYLLSRPYSVVGKDDVIEFMKDQLQMLKDTTDELYKKGEVWWEFEADPDSVLKFKITMRKAQKIVPRYVNEEETEYDAVGYLWNKIEGDNTLRYVDFVDIEGRHRFPLSGVSEEVEDLGHATDSEGGAVSFKKLPFIRLTSDGLYQQISMLSKMYSQRYKQADILLEDNSDPVAVITNASETDPEILQEDIRRYKLVKVEGDGAFTYVARSTNYSSIEAFMKMAKSDIADICGTVSREQELSYVTSGRALDRLYVDMDADAADMGFILREALKAFLAFVDEEKSSSYLDGFDIIFNTDKPTDEQQIISNINSSKDLLSTETLLKQHPWVEDVQEEMKKKEEEKSSRPAPTPVEPTTQTTQEELESSEQAEEGVTTPEEDL